MDFILFRLWWGFLLFPAFELESSIESSDVLTLPNPNNGG